MHVNNCDYFSISTFKRNMLIVSCEFESIYPSDSSSSSQDPVYGGQTKIL